jgi:hypothetical protein
MALTGDAGGPPLALPGELTNHLDRVAATLTAHTGQPLDGPALLGERAALGRLRRHGRTSCGGPTRLLEAADGWVAVCLAREDDVALLPALLEVELDDDPWTALSKELPHRTTAEVVERAGLLGLPVGALPDEAPPAGVRASGVAGSPRALRGLHVADLGALWAGPLCAQLLGTGGATVTKVETASRPDGARRGNRRFWKLLNGGKGERLVGLPELRDVLEAADVVVLSSRRRAYEQLGIDIDAVVRSRTDKVVVAITGHGWDDERVAFGDDAAVAGGLVARHPADGAPRFVADAAADPLTGLHAAAAAAQAATSGGQWFIDAALARVAATCAAAANAREPGIGATRRRSGWMLETDDGAWPVAPPRARQR